MNQDTFPAVQRPMVLGAYTPNSGLGNKMTQFASLYALSRDLELPINILPVPGLSQTGKASSPRPPLSPIPQSSHCVIPGRHYIPTGWRVAASGQTVTTRPGNYLENTYNFYHRSEEIRELFRYPSYGLHEYAFFQGPLDRLVSVPIASIEYDDLVISLRLGDFVHKPNADQRWRQCVYSRFLGYSYFQIVLNQLQFSRLFITSDEPFHPLTREFDDFDPIRVRNDNPLKTMALVRQFKRIAISESTFSWWAAYLSDAEEIYFPISTTGLWGINDAWDIASASWRPSNELNVRDRDLYMRVDEDRYRYVHQDSGIIYRYRDAPGRRSLADFEEMASLA